MEAIITIVGFLGAGKTSLLKHLFTKYVKDGWDPFVILNDYENAHIDSQYFLKQLNPDQVLPLNGSCICCSGINELRNYVNRIPERKNGITLIEANGTSDACSLMGFLGVGLNKRFLPPIQISVVDVKNWQNRGEHNELESNQIQVSSLLILTHLENVSKERLEFVKKEIKSINSQAKIIPLEEIDISLLPKIFQSKNNPKQLDHLKAHWSSCSVDLPILPDSSCIEKICNELPARILRIKGCAQIGKEKAYTFFEKTPDGKVFVRPFNGTPITGPKLITIGPGSDPLKLNQAIQKALSFSK